MDNHSMFLISFLLIQVAPEGMVGKGKYLHGMHKIIHYLLNYTSIRRHEEGCERGGLKIRIGVFGMLVSTFVF